ncbi:MAG TPA: hypothetical protein VD997_13495 [Phycisphaerales bacterium]|nr:hypothetical protein [Phycisphaerales bacterium]
MRSLAPLALALAALAAPATAGVTTYTVDFFPEEPGTYLQQLRFMGPTEGTIVAARLHIEFTTSNGFQAENFYWELFAPVDNDAFGYWGVTGADLNWLGEGTFTATISTTDLNGPLGQRLWAWHLWSLNDPPEVSGSWSMTSRVEIDIETGSNCGTSDFNGDGDFGTDQDIEAFFACLGGSCCETCYAGGADFNGDGDTGTDQDIESFFRVLGGGAC